MSWSSARLKRSGGFMGRTASLRVERDGPRAWIAFEDGTERELPDSPEVEGLLDALELARNEDLPGAPTQPSRVPDAYTWSVSIQNAAVREWSGGELEAPDDSALQTLLLAASRVIDAALAQG